MLLFLASLLVMIFKAYVFAVLWGWFIAPFGVPAVDVKTAFGVLTVIGIATTQYPSETDGIKLLSFSFAISLISLAIGFIAHVI